MFKDIRVITSLILILVILQTTGCTGNTTSVQIGGTNNSVDQSGRSTTTQTETASSQTPPQVSEQPVVEEQDETQNEDQRIAELQKLADEQRIALERAEEEQREAERQHAEQLRVERENSAEQLRQAQELYSLEQARHAEEQRLAEVKRQRLAEEQRLIQTQQRTATPVTSNQTAPPRVIAVYPSRASAPSQRSYTYTNGNVNSENFSKKGHSTRNKILVGTAIVSGTALGVWLGRRHR